MGHRAIATYPSWYTCRGNPCGCPGYGGDVALRIERQNATKRRLPHLLAEIEQSGLYDSTLYVVPRYDAAHAPHAAREALDALSPSETGAAVFVGAGRAVAIAPPFPLGVSGARDGADAGPLRELLARQTVVGVVLLRLGRYAVGVLRGETLVASKTDTRYVKNRHRKGGSSQRRFERSRERLVRELFDKACDVSRQIFAPHTDDMDYILLGGERHTLRAFVKRCAHLRRAEGKLLSRVLSVQRPNNAALAAIAREVWQSRVVFTTDERYTTT